MADYPFERDEVRQLTGEQLFKLLDDWINCNGNISNKLPTTFSIALNATHRTLQESFISMFFNVLVQYGKDHQEDYSFDDRNEDAVKLCRKLVALVEKEELPNYLRFI
jgi:hypothetical protein